MVLRPTATCLVVILRDAVILEKGEGAIPSREHNQIQVVRIRATVFDYVRLERNNCPGPGKERYLGESEISDSPA